MSYFDHVRCHHCNSQLNPDSLSAGMACPVCGGTLDLSDLFGVADAFSGVEGPEATLDDLLAPQRAYADDPLKQFAQQQHQAHAARQAARREQRASSRQPAPPASSGGTGLVHQPRRDDDDDVGGTPSALELMRRMKKGR